MSSQVVIFTVVAVIIVVVSIGAWLLDARRNKNVAEDEERLDQ